MMNKLIKLMFIGCSIIAFNSFSQDETKLNAAFLSSYDFEAKGSYDLSIKSLEDVYDKTSYIINLRLGWLNYANKNYENSIKYYQIATLLMPSSEEALWALINPLVAKEKWNDVDKAYLAIIAIDPKNSKAHYQLGLNYYYRKNYIAAKKYFDVSLGLYPYDYNSVLMSGWNHYFLGNKEEAKLLFNRILLMYPTDTSAKEGLGLIK